jgi:hypothetical protein
MNVQERDLKAFYADFQFQNKYSIGMDRGVDINGRKPEPEATLSF